MATINSFSSHSTKNAESIWLLMTILAISILSGAEVDLFIPSFPELQKVFQLSPFMVQLTLSMNFIAYCICSLFAGTFGDRFNRRSVILISLIIFVLGSIFCVFANHFSLLIIGRFLQGVGMAGPAVLGYVIIADEYPIEKQAGIMGILNGLVTFAMAFAPVLGCYINVYFSWRGNFVVLLGLSLICLAACYLVIPNNKGQTSVSLSPKAYLPLFKSKRLIYSILGLCFLFVPYWVFIGMSPLLYMEAMQVDIKHFGYYQGAIAGVFSIVSLLSPKILQKLGHERALRWGNLISFIAMLGMLLAGIFKIMDPILITGLMMIFAVAVVFPVNVLYPQTLNILEEAKSRAAALINSFRLLLTAGSLQLISYYYIGQFFPISVANFILVILYLIFMLVARNKQSESTIS